MRDRFSIAEGHFLFGFSVLLLFLYSSVAYNHDFLTFALLAELVIFLGPVVFMTRYMGISFKKAVNWNKMTVKQWCYSFLFFSALIPTVILLNILTALFFEMIGLQSESGLPLPQSTGELVLQMLIIAGITSLCEEIFFRGMLYNALHGESNNKRFSMVFSGFLFAIMHFDILNFVNPFFLGIVFAMVNHQTQSIFSSIIGHTLINSMVILLTYSLNSGGMASDQVLLSEWQLGIGVAILIGSVFATIYFYRQLASLKRNTEVEKIELVLNYSLAEWLVYEKSFIIPLGVVLFYSLLTFAFWVQ